jgi:type II secretory pathway component PulF
MEFRCRLVSAAGEVSEGVFVAESEARLRQELDDRGLHVLDLQARGSVGGWTLRLPQRRRVGPREFMEFNQELATLLKAGMPLVQSLDLLRTGVKDQVFRPVLDGVFDQVKAGTALSDAFDAHGDLFPRVYTASLMAGERSGNLEIVLRRYVAYAKLIGAVRRKTLSALMYPTVLVGDVARKFAISQLARTLSTLLGGGIPLVNALDVAARAVSNRFIARELVGMAQGVREGQSLADTMRVRTVFPDVAIKMTEVGEATGALQDMLTSLAEFYDEEVETKLDRFVTLVEPVLLITMGIVIAGLLLALYLPLFQLSSVVS